MTAQMTKIAAAVARIRDEIRNLEARYGRLSGSVRLVAVSKTRPVAAVQEAIAAGQREFGENQLQDGLVKLNALAEPGLRWHFIGPVQANKTRTIAARFDWVHSIDRGKIARRLSDQRPSGLPPLNVCLQVNISGEASKSGLAPEQVPALAEEVALLPGLRLRGLMTLPGQTADLALQRKPFAQLHRLREELAAAGLALDTLSMGMTGDMEAAIAEGATMVRVGTAIFGQRQLAWGNQPAPG